MELKNNKGLTLVSVVIAITVMTILLATVLVITLKDDGIIGVAKDAKDGMEESSLYQSVAEAVVTSKKKNGKVNEESLENKLQVIDENSTLVYNDVEKTYTVKVKGNVYVIEEYGNIKVEE